MRAQTCIRAILFIGLIAGTAFASDDAQASTTIGGASGKSYYPGDGACFGNSGYGGITNVCASPSRTFVWYPPVPDTGITTTDATFSGSATCGTYVFSAGGILEAQSPIIVASNTMTWGFTSRSTEIVEIRCTMAQNSTVNSVSWW